LSVARCVVKVKEEGKVKVKKEGKVKSYLKAVC
jgi:hypothetical protein